jgi:hypothetical protein
MIPKAHETFRVDVSKDFMKGGETFFKAKASNRDVAQIQAVLLQK